MAHEDTLGLEQYGEDDTDTSMASHYRPSCSTGVYGSYALIIAEVPKNMDTLQQYGEGGMHEATPSKPSMPSYYRPSYSNGIYGSYVLKENPSCVICQYHVYSDRVELDCCGVALHNQCFIDFIQSKEFKPGQKITLSALSCVYCRDRVKQKHSDDLLASLNSLYDKLRNVALDQLGKNGNCDDNELIEEEGEFYKNPIRYAMILYSFRICYNCNDPYCVGAANYWQAFCERNHKQIEQKEELEEERMLYICSRETCSLKSEPFRQKEAIEIKEDYVEQKEMEENQEIVDKINNELSSIKSNPNICRDNIFNLAKQTYKKQAKPVIVDNNDTINDIKQNAVQYQNVALPLTLCQDLDFKEWDEHKFKQEFSTKFEIPIECIIILSVREGSTIIDMKIETHRNGTELIIPIEVIAEKISTKKAQKGLAEFKIFAMEFEKPTVGFTPLKQRVIMNPRWNREYGPGYIDWDGPLKDGKWRGNEPYYCPKGWKKFAIQFNETAYDFDSVYDKWPIAYHGTKFDFAYMIALSGLMCSNKCAVWGVGVYLSPSIKYVSHPRYCKPVKFDLSKAKQSGITPEYVDALKKYDGKWIQCAFVCRVKPGEYKKYPETMGLGQNGIFDNIDKKKIEWVVRGKHGEIIGSDKILIYGIMIRASITQQTGYNDYDRDLVMEITKCTYKQDKKPLIFDDNDTVNEIKQNAKDYKNVALPLTVYQDTDFKEWDEEIFKEQFSKIINIPVTLINITSSPNGKAATIVNMKLETHLNGNQLLVPIECITENISTDKVQSALARFGIFAMVIKPAISGFTPFAQTVIMNSRFDREYGPGHINWDGPLNDGRSRGNEPYYCPKGWKKFAIELSESAYDFENVYSKWPIAYYPTKFRFAMMGKVWGLKCQSKTIQQTLSGLYLSPSIKYISHPTYCEPVKLKLSESKRWNWSENQIKSFKKYDGKWIQCVFQCRVKPGCYTKMQGSMGRKGKFDNIALDQIEWIIPGGHGEIIKSDKILIAGIMIKANNKRPMGYDEYVVDDDRCVLM